MMLPERNIGLQRRPVIVDQRHAMRVPPRKTDDADQPSDTRADTTLFVRQLAHELNSLLDGSLRSLRMAEEAVGPEANPATLADVKRRLKGVGQAMDEIAAVLGRAMTGETSGLHLLRSRRTLDEEARHLMATLAPTAGSVGVALELEVAPEVASAPAGPLGTLLSHALRNAIAACAVADGAPRRVVGAVCVDPERSQLIITVVDTGPDAVDRADGHGVGLTVCRDVVVALGGRIEIDAGPGGDGTLVRAEIPLENMTWS